MQEINNLRKRATEPITKTLDETFLNEGETPNIKINYTELGHDYDPPKPVDNNDFVYTIGERRFIDRGRQTGIELEKMVFWHNDFLNGDKRHVFGHLLDIALFVFLFVWVVFTTVVGILKLTTGQDSVESYFAHFTNWGWTVQWFFYLLFLLAYADTRHSVNQMQMTLFVWLFWFTQGVVWSIFFLVYLMFDEDSDIVYREAIEEYGLGTTLLGDRIFHVHPGLAQLVFIIMHARVIVLYYQYYHLFIFGRSLGWRVGYIVLQTVGPYLLGLSYLIIVPYEEVYGLDNPWIIAGSALLSIFVFVTLPLMYLTFYGYDVDERTNLALFHFNTYQVYRPNELAPTWLHLYQEHKMMKEPDRYQYTPMKNDSKIFFHEPSPSTSTSIATIQSNGSSKYVPLYY